MKKHTSQRVPSEKAGNAETTGEMPQRCADKIQRGPAVSLFPIELILRVHSFRN